MEQPIEDRGRHDVIAQGPAPVGESLVRRQQNAATFVTGRHQLEQQMGGLRRHREVAKFVNLCEAPIYVEFLVRTADSGTRFSFGTQHN